jgi:hypothetical protein
VTPEHGDAPMTRGTEELLRYFTRPDAYLPLLKAYPKIRVCLAHFGGAGDLGHSSSIRGTTRASRTG